MNWQVQGYSILESQPLLVTCLLSQNYHFFETDKVICGSFPVEVIQQMFAKSFAVIRRNIEELMYKFSVSVSNRP
jgi:hypothetical protein